MSSVSDVLSVSEQAFQLHGYLYTLYFLAYFGDMFFSLFSIIWVHSVAASSLNFSGQIWSRSLILLFPQENRTFGISGINLWGAENAPGGQFIPLKKKIFLRLIWANFVAPFTTLNVVRTMQLKGLLRITSLMPAQQLLVMFLHSDP
jgi:hypothetical protein